MIRMVYKYYDDIMRTMQFAYYKKLKCYIRVEDDILIFMGVKGNPNAVKKNFMRIYYGIVSIYYGNLSWMGLENAQAPAKDPVHGGDGRAVVGEGHSCGEGALHA